MHRISLSPSTSAAGRDANIMSAGRRDGSSSNLRRANLFLFTYCVYGANEFDCPSIPSDQDWNSISGGSNTASCQGVWVSKRHCICWHASLQLSRLGSSYRVELVASKGPREECFSSSNTSSATFVASADNLVLPRGPYAESAISTSRAILARTSLP